MRTTTDSPKGPPAGPHVVSDSTSAVAQGAAVGGEPSLGDWYAVAFARDVQAGALTPIEVLSERYVLFRDAQDSVCCLRDRCPHRGARLSDGRIAGGKVECGYHGWQFEGGGRCAHVPQLDPGSEIPAGLRATSQEASVRDGIVWVRCGTHSSSTSTAVPVIVNPSDPDVHTIDFTIDLPYGYDALIENVLDLAHIHVAHDGARGGGHRRHAGPLCYEIEDLGPAGFRARIVSATVDDTQSSARTTGGTVALIAPGLVHYSAEFDDPSRRSGLALYATPIASGDAEKRCPRTLPTALSRLRKHVLEVRAPASPVARTPEPDAFA